MSEYLKYVFICRVFGHRKSVIWNMDKLTGVFCNRCKHWISKESKNE